MEYKIQEDVYGKVFGSSKSETENFIKDWYWLNNTTHYWSAYNPLDALSLKYENKSKKK